MFTLACEFTVLKLLWMLPVQPLSQRQLNTLFTGPDFLLTARYSQVLNTVSRRTAACMLASSNTLLFPLSTVCIVGNSPLHADVSTQMFVTLLYSSGIPLLVPICVCMLGVAYWVDKFLLCRFYRMPPLVRCYIWNHSVYHIRNQSSLPCLCACVPSSTMRSLECTCRRCCPSLRWHTSRSRCGC